VLQEYAARPIRFRRNFNSFVSHICETYCRRKFAKQCDTAQPECDTAQLDRDIAQLDRDIAQPEWHRSAGVWHSLAGVYKVNAVPQADSYCILTA